MLPESRAVNVAVIWEESCCSYPGRSCRREVGNPKAAVTTNCKKSAEAIVPCFFFKGRAEQSQVLSTDRKEVSVLNAEYQGNEGFLQRDIFKSGTSV